MHKRYALTNNDDGLYISYNVSDRDVYVRILQRDKIFFSDEYKLGFWKKKTILEPLIQKILDTGVAKSKTEAENLVYSAFQELIKTYEIKEIPPGFVIDTSLYSTAKDKEENIIRKLISHTPAWVSNLYHNYDSDAMMIDIAFYKNPAELAIVTLPQKDALQRRGIMEIAAKGALLEESKANQFINWMTNYIHTNDIPLSSVYERFGWKEELSFVSGNKKYSKDKTSSVKIINVPDKSIQGLGSAGTTGEWIDMTRKILKYNKTRLKCYAACTAPLLKLLNQKSFILHDYGESSTGKTKTSEVGMSIWGNPAPLLMSSFGTTVGKERLATIFTDLPILVDETQISSEEDNKIFIYLIANETGKLRGLKDGGLQDTANWKTVAFTTGEAPITTDKSFMGMAMRVVEIYGGLGAHDKEAIDDFKIGVESCYGVLGEYIIKEIIDNYKDLHTHFNKLNVKFNTLAADLNASLNGVGGRAASMFAVLALGGIIFEEVLAKLGGEPKDAPVICAEIYREYINTMARSGYSSRAYEHFMSWMHTKEKYFLHDMMELDTKGPYECYGNVTDTYIDIFPTILKETIEKAGFNYKRVLKDWTDNKIIELYEDKNGQEFTNYTVWFFKKAKKVKRINILDL